MDDVGQLIKRVGLVPRARADFTSNFFATPAKVQDWITAGRVSFMDADEAVIVLRRDASLTRTYHIAATRCALRAALTQLVDQLGDRTLVTDLVSKEPGSNGIAGVYLEHDFTPRARLVRMQRIAEPIVTSDRPNVVDAATADDIPRLVAFLDTWLDAITEQPPDAAELVDTVASGQVLVTRQADELTGILVYETIGLNSALRYWHVAGRYRNRGIGARLLRAFLDRCASSKRIVLWVFHDNANAIAKYRHYGFRFDGLADEIMARQPRVTAQ